MDDVEARKHHVRNELCLSRPAYREGRKPTAVKVYTVHHESRHLIVQGVPAVGAGKELAKVFSSYGAVTEIHPLDDYPADKFSEVYLVKFQKIQSARFAKRKLDDYSFFGGVLHVSYAPEYESVQETREKLQDRRKVIAAKIRQQKKNEDKPSQHQLKPSWGSGPHSVEGPSRNMLPPPPPPPPPPPGVSVHVGQPPPDVAICVPPPPKPLHGRTNVADNRQADSLPGTNDDEINSCPPHHFTEEMLRLPPPPVPSLHPPHPHYHLPHAGNPRKQFEFAWVPTANATFPPGFDARLPPLADLGSDADEGRVANNTPSSVVDSSPVLSEFTQLVHKKGDTYSSLNNRGRSASENNTPAQGVDRSKDKVIVKNYKPKGPAPRFVPRQIQAKSDANKKQEETAKSDELNREIRSNAFQLAEEQGADLPDDPVVRELLMGQRPVVEPKVEASVVKTVKDIRKRLTKRQCPRKPRKATQRTQFDRKRKEHQQFPSVI